MTASYRFHHEWEAPAAPEVVASVLEDLAGYPSWWPQVVAVADLGNDSAWVVCRSRLPYTLDMILTATERSPGRLRVRVTGDLDGWVCVDLRPTTGGTRVTFSQEVEVSGWLALVSPLLRGAMRWNHAQMMRGLEHGLVERLRG